MSAMYSAMQSAAAYVEMPPLLGPGPLEQPIYAYLPRPAVMVGSVSRAKSKKSWLRLAKERRPQPQVPSPIYQHHQQPQQIHPAALIHRDYLQEYREKFGSLAVDHLEPWNAPLRQFVHPAVVAAASPTTPAYSHYSEGSGGICACPGTKKLGKVCKTCGQRAAKGTVRGGTITRGGGETPKRRPALPLPPTPNVRPMRLNPTPVSPDDDAQQPSSPERDPYDFVRRARMPVKEQLRRSRSKSLSPNRASTHGDDDEWVMSSSSSSDTSGAEEDEEVGGERGEPEGAPSRRSILECDVSAYELIDKYLRRRSDDADELDENVVAEVAVAPQVEKCPELVRTGSLPALAEAVDAPKPPPRRRRLKKASIKSILKKTSVSSEEGPCAQPITGLHIPTYQEFKQQRKKQVQFKELRQRQEKEASSDGNDLGPRRPSAGFSSCAAAAAVEEPLQSERPPQRQQQQPQQSQADRSAGVSECVAEQPVPIVTTPAEERSVEPPLEKTQKKAANKPIVPPISDDGFAKAKGGEALGRSGCNRGRVRGGGSIVHVRADRSGLFLDTMRLRVVHRRGDARQVFASSALSPTRPREPPPPPPPATAPKGEVVVVGGASSGSTVVTVNQPPVENLTLRISVGAADPSNATVVTLGGGDENHNYEHVPHICTKMADPAIIQKVENTRRSRCLSTEAPYVSIRVNGADEEPPYISVVCSDSGKDEPSITDDEGSNGSSKVYVTVEDEEEEEGFDDEEIEGHYEMIRDPIYEEISPPVEIVQEVAPAVAPCARSIFEGASKSEILQYLAGARARGFQLGPAPPPLDLPSLRNSISAPLELVSHVSDSSDDSHTPLRSSPAKSRRSSAEIERNDSGVGSETSQSSRSRWLLQRRTNSDQGDLLCEDCEQTVEPQVTDSGVVFAPLVCRKCGKRRSERREIISELLETELKYGRDLQIMMDEFYRPMLVAGLLTQEQLDAIFLNVPELLEMSKLLAERLQDAVDIALDQGDEDLLTVNVGRQFIDCTLMLNAFESYCIRQGAASVLLANLEKEKELLKIFLRVSQMENAVLRRMNLNSFLMVPVQRVTKYPLLLSRLHKTTPPHLEARELLKLAQQKIEAHLEHMNAEAKEISSTKLWRRISIINVPGSRRSNSEADLSAKLRRAALDVLGWAPERAHFVLEGRLLFAQATDSNWRKGRTIKLSHLNALLVAHSKPNHLYQPGEQSYELTFPKATGIQDACLLLLKDKAGRCTLVREPLSLDKCIVCAEALEVEGCFEVQQMASRDSFIFKSEARDEWVRVLRLHTNALGQWRRRRNALANIMMCPRP